MGNILVALSAFLGCCVFDRTGCTDSVLFCCGLWDRVALSFSVKVEAGRFCFSGLPWSIWKRGVCEVDFVSVSVSGVCPEWDVVHPYI